MYLEIPDGFEATENKSKFVLKFNRALYGLNQAPKAWNEKLNQTLSNFGLQRSASDLCL